jgi:hypothetical protein
LLFLSRDRTKAGRAPGRRAAALAAAAVVAGGIWLTVPAASAASPGCGPNCIDLFNQKFGPGDVPMVSGAATAGQSVVLSGASDSTAQDWTRNPQGTVSELYAAGLMNPTLGKHYGTDETYEFAYAPDGVDSGLCLGIASGPRQSTPVTLQPCGVSVRTLWIWDATDQSGGNTPFISGNDAQYPAPYVLTADTAGGNLTTQALKTNPDTAAQRWSLVFGQRGPDWADSTFCSLPWANESAQPVPQYFGVAYNGVAACGNSDSVGNNQGPISYTLPSGTRVYFDNGPEPGTGFQCVELAARYLYFETMQVPSKLPGSGRVFVSDLPNQDAASDARGTDEFDSSVTAGNIISMWTNNAKVDPSGDGHVAVVTSVDVVDGTGTIYVMDENASTQVLLGGLANDEIAVNGGQMRYYVNGGFYDHFQWTTNLPGSG